MDSDDEVEEQSSVKGIPATIIYINLHDNNVAEIAHAASCRLMRQYLRSSNNMYTSICLFGLEDSNSSKYEIKSIRELFALTLPTVDAFKSLQNVEISSMKPSTEFKLSDVLWNARKMFRMCTKLLLSRTVIILSKFDVPPELSDHKPSFKEAGDIYDANIDVKLISISETDYKIDDFYRKLLIELNKSTDITLPSPVWDVKEVEQLMNQQCNRHLAVSSLNFEIGDDLFIGVGVYSLLKGNTDPKKTYLDSETNAILTSVNTTVKVKVNDDEDMDHDGEQTPNELPLLKSEILHYQTFGGEKVEFTDNEMKKLRNPFGMPNLKLLGFKPAQFICKEKLVFKPCYFLFPKEGLIEGSTVAFKALHQACIETNMVAICILSTRVNSRPMLIALIPCSNPLGMKVDIGFDVVPLPLMENMRNFSMNDDLDNVKIEDANKLVMKDILIALKFDYKAEMFENPKLQSLYRALEAIAFEDEEIDPFVDTTKPDPVKFNTIKDDLFYEVFGTFEIEAPKRSANSTEGSKTKKVKTETIVDEALLQERINAEQVNKYTVPQLKEVLWSKECPGLPALNGLKKDELVNLVYKYFK